MSALKPRTIVFVTLAAAVALAAAAAFFYQRGVQPGPSAAGGGIGAMESSLVRLSTSDNSRERLLAARWLGQQPASMNSSAVQTLGQSLMSDPDPAVRSAVAASFGDLAASRQQAPGSVAPHEPQMIEALSAAFDLESNASVRRSIVEAAARFDHPDAALMLNKALVDVDPAVREAAQEAKIQRERRKLVSVSG